MCTRFAGAALDALQRGEHGFQFNGPSSTASSIAPARALGAVTYFTDLGGNSHSFKAGIDYQHLSSSSQFAVPSTTRSFRRRVVQLPDPDLRARPRRDYAAPLPIHVRRPDLRVYARDKFEIGKHVFLELGLRYEHQRLDDDDQPDSRSSAGTGVAPVSSIAYDIFGTGKSLGRRDVRPLLPVRAAGLLRRPSARTPRRRAYDNYVLGRLGVRLLEPRRRLRQLGSDPPQPRPTYNRRGDARLSVSRSATPIGASSLTGIYRKWNNIIDDIPILSPDDRRPDHARTPTSTPPKPQVLWRRSSSSTSASPSTGTPTSATPMAGPTGNTDRPTRPAPSATT